MIKSRVKAPGSTGGGHARLDDLRATEARGTPGVAVECVEIGKNTSGEGGRLGRRAPFRGSVRRSCAKAWGANRIRYPGSPRCKRWVLGVVGIDPRGAEAYAISAPPGEYGRKAETQRN